MPRVLVMTGGSGGIGAAVARRFAASPAGRYLVLGLGTGDDPAPAGLPDGLVAYGPLLSDDGDTWVGTAALLQASDPSAARAILPPDGYATVEVHHWAAGGRPESFI